MANMSAQILRNLVSSVFNVKATNVVLSGEISPTYVPQLNNGHSWWTGGEEERHHVWGFSPRRGFVPLCVGRERFSDALKREYTFSQNGETVHEEGMQLCDLHNVEEFIFFVINKEGKDYGDNGEEYNGWELYKAPDFKSHWEEIEAADVTRWESWLNA